MKQFEDGQGNRITMRLRSGQADARGLLERLRGRGTCRPLYERSVIQLSEDTMWRSHLVAVPLKPLGLKNTTTLGETMYNK